MCLRRTSGLGILGAAATAFLALEFASVQAAQTQAQTQAETQTRAETQNQTQTQNPASPPTPPRATASEAARRKPGPKPKPTPPPPPVIDGLVKDPSGKPLEGARVYFRPMTDPWSQDPLPPKTTDAAGRFRLDLRKRIPHDVRVEAKGFGAWRKERVAPGSRLEATLDKGRTIEGLVRDENGQPAPGAKVEAISRGTVGGGYWDGDAGVRRTETDTRGRFRLEGLDASLHSVAAWSGTGRARRDSVRTGTSLTLTLRAQAVVAGLVTDPDGVPLPGALVRHAKEPHFWNQGFLVTTGADGRFEIVGLEAGAYSLVARHPDFAPAVATGVSVETRGQAEVRLTLHPGGPVEGRLVDGEGRPVAGRARLGPAEAEAPPALGEILKAEADSEGRFRIPRVGPGSYALTASAEGFASQRVDVTVSERMAATEVGDVVLERGLSIRGQVRTGAGLPVAEATVSCQQQRSMYFSWPSETRSREDGSFDLGGLVAGQCALRATAPGHGSGRATAEVGAENVAIVLAPAGRLAGRVAEEGDTPVEAYQVRAERADVDQNARYEDGRLEAVASLDGRFSIEDLNEGSYVLQVIVPDRTPAAVSGLVVAAGRTTDAGTIRVGRGGVVKGTVASGAGGAISGATVRLRTPGQDFVRWVGGYVAESEPDGGFEIRGVPTGKATVDASHPDYAPASLPVDVDPAGGPTEARLVLAQGGRIEGAARKRDGSPLAGHSIHIWPRQAGGMFEMPQLVTAADGSFAADHLPPGPTSVVLMANVGPGVFTNMASADTTVREGETSVVPLVVQDILLSGRVTRAGNPLPGATVEAQSQGGMSMMVGGSPNRDAVAPSGPLRNRATAREDGSYEMIVGGPGKYFATVRFGRVGFPNRPFDVPDVDAHVMDFAFAGTTVSGLVVDKETGAPPPKAHVSSSGRDNGEGWVGAPLGPDGRFEMEVEPGRRTITARAEGYAPADLETDVPTEGTSDLRFELEKGLALRGRLLDRSGQRLSGMQVTLRSAGKPPLMNFTQTLPDGSFAFEGLKDGTTYAVCAGSPLVGYAVRTGVSAGATDVSLTLRPGGRLEVRIVGPDGAPRPKSFPWVRRVGGVEVNVPTMGGQPTGEDGRTTIDVPAGAIEITARDETWQGAANVTVEEGGTASVEIRMDQPAERLR